MTQVAVKEDWKRVQDRLSERVGEDLFRIYLRNTLVVQLAPEALEIGVPSVVIGEYLEDKFTADILASVHDTLGYKPKTIKFSVNGHLFRKMRDGQKPSADERAETARRADARAAEAEEEVMPAPRGTFQPRRPERIFHLNERYRLESFVVGPNSKLAFNCAVEVSRNPGGKYSPLFVYGGVGMGKTHLLQGIALQLDAHRKDLAVFYVSGEYFVNQYLQAIRAREIDSFRLRFRNVDVLIIDDVQFFAGKPKCQEELLHTLKALETLDRQVVLAGLRHPKELEDVSEFLRSRFVQGMVAEIKEPAASTRVSLIKAKLGPRRDQFPDATIHHLANKLNCSVRELEGCVTQLVALAGITDEKMSVPLVQQALGDLLASKSRLVEMSDIENVVIAHFGVSSADLHGRSRERNIASARQVCMYLSRRLTQHSLKEIGRFFGGKNHTTVVFAAQKITQSVEDDAELKGTVERLVRQLTDR